MKGTTLLRLCAVVAVVLLAGWLVRHTRWVDVEIDDAPHGVAATDAVYSLRRLLESAGATLETRTSLEPMPPAGATLMLDSSLWDIFPERDARLKAWVENGGHLVVLGQHARGHEELRWVPLSFATPASARAAAASDADGGEDNEDGDDEQAPATRRKPQDDDAQKKRLARLLDPKRPWRDCRDLEEAGAASVPAFEPGRVYRGCGAVGSLRALGHAVPTWKLAGKTGTLAMRVPLGRGSVTGVSPWLVLDNRGILAGDNALIAVAVLQAGPGRAVWILGDEAREPLLRWLWQEARTPLLLALAATLLALWRLMVRFGPRESEPPSARRSMGEQVRGTGQFIAGTDPRALHAATRKAFDDVARLRVERWAELEDAERIAALAREAAPSQPLDRPALLASMNIGGGATPAQILAAIAVLEQARRALLRTPAAPPQH